MRQIIMQIEEGVIRLSHKLVLLLLWHDNNSIIISDQSLLCTLINLPVYISRAKLLRLRNMHQTSDTYILNKFLT